MTDEMEKELKNSDLFRHLSLPESQRDEKWEKRFFELLPDVSVKIESDKPISGPDGWPYLSIRIEKGATEPVLKVLKWASQKGVGIVINAFKNLPDYVFTYGMIWNYFESGKFASDLELDAGQSSSQYEFTPGEKVYLVDPVGSFVPSYVANILRDFFRQQSIENPKWTMLSRDKKRYDLVFSLESLGNPDQNEHEEILEALGWFFPNHFTFGILSENLIQGFSEISTPEKILH